MCVFFSIIQNGHTVCKVRGFSLNNVNKKIINFETVKDVVFDETRTKTYTVVNDKKIVRDKASRKLLNKREAKKYRLVFNKRVILDNYETVPYGYRTN